MSKDKVVIDICSTDKLNAGDTGQDFYIDISNIQNFLAINGASGIYSMYVDRISIDQDTTAEEYVEVRIEGISSFNKFKPTKTENALLKSYVLTRGQFKGTLYFEQDNIYVGQVLMPFSDQLHIQIFDYTDGTACTGTIHTAFRLVLKAYKDKFYLR
jgi:hypothetical protein